MACCYRIKDKHTGLYIRIVNTEHTGAPHDFEIELTSNPDRASTVAGWGYALNAAMALEMPFILERV